MIANPALFLNLVFTVNLSFLKRFRDRTVTVPSIKKILPFLTVPYRPLP
jgi:hypothetical protein